MSLKLKKPSTPNKSVSKVNGASSGSGSKKKQLSLMSFFKPASKPGQESSPLKSKNNSEFKDGSDKENESILEDTQLTDTPLTSETSAAVDTTYKRSKPDFPESSPVKQENLHENPKKPLSDSSNNAVPDSSPVSKRSSNKSISYAESDAEEDANISHASRKRRKIVESDDDEDEFNPGDAEADEDDDEDDDMSDFVVDDNDESGILCEGSGIENEDKEVERSYNKT